MCVTFFVKASSSAARLYISKGDIIETKESISKNYKITVSVGLTWLLLAATLANSAWDTFALFISCWISS